MPVKSVLEIDVSSGEFDQFQRKFQKFQDQLAKMPKSWQQAAKEQKSSVSSFQKMTESMMQQARAHQALMNSSDKWRQNLQQTDQLWGSIAKHATGISSSIANATRSLLSWTGILAGIGGGLIGGGLFGIDRLAGNVGNQRRSAKGLGLSIGAEKAFGLDFGRFVDADSYLNFISRAEADPRQATGMYALGLQPTGNTEADSLSMLKAIRAKAKATPDNLLGMLPGMFKLDMGLDELRRLKGSTDEEFNTQWGRYGTDRNRLDVPEKNARKFQDLMNTLSGNWGAVSSSFINRAAELAPSLSKLSDSFTKLATTMINSPQVGEGLKTVSKWIEKFAATVGAPDFQKKVDDFADRFGKGVGQFVDGAERTAAAVERIAKSLEPFAGLLGGGGPKDKTIGGTKNRFLDQLATLEANSGLPKGLLAYQFQTESSGIFNPRDNEGHVGPFQFDPKTAKWLNKLYHKGHHPLDPRKPGEAAILASDYDQWLMQHYGGNVKNVIGAYNWGPKNMDAYLKTGRGARGQEMPDETRSYMSGARVSGSGSNITVTVNVTTPPGSDLTASASAMAH